MKDHATSFLFIATAIIGLMVALVLHNQPVVVKSTKTGECVEVLFDEKHSCDNLPESYSLEWAE